MPQSHSDWMLTKRCWATDHRASECRSIAQQCRLHHNTRHYVACLWLAEGKWGPNPSLHNNEVPHNVACCIERLLTGGQGLCGCDPRGEVLPTKFNCCVFCLAIGLRRTESLEHVTFHCEAYSGLRRKASIRNALIDQDCNVFKLHRKWWSWRQIKDLRSFFTKVWATRTDLAGGAPRVTRLELHERADRLW